MVSQTPNQHMLVGFPGISATLPRLEGKVELRPKDGVSAPLTVSLVTVCLQRRESIHPQSDSMIQRHLAAPRKEVLELVGKEMLLYRCPKGKEEEQVYAMDLPFVLFIPYGREGAEAAQRVPAASLQLPHRTAETLYEIIVTVQQGASFNSKFNFPTPISRYDTLSTFGMYNRQETAERTTDHLVTLGITLPKWSYGPHDQIKIYVKLAPNPDWPSKAKKVKIKRLAIGVDEEIIYNHEGDEPVRKTRSLASNKLNVDQPLPDAGYWTEMGLLFPAVDQRREGILPRGDNAFPRYAVSGFTTTGSLYKIEYYLTVKVRRLVWI